MHKFKKRRRQAAFERLEAQLKSGKKQEKINGKQTGKMVELGDKDKSRIKSEMELLKNRV